MKKSLVALAALAATGVFAQTLDGKPGFQITGNLNAGYVNQNYMGNKVSGFEQNGMATSSIFFRGLEDLGGGMSAYFQHGTDLQFMTANGDRGTMFQTNASMANMTTTLPSINLATNAVTAATTPAIQNKGAVGTFGNDQKLVGIGGSFGNINFGTINNQSLYNGIVLINPVVGTSYSGGYGSTVCADPTCTVVRYDNTLEYKSPVMSGFQGFLQYSPKQNSATNKNAPNYTTTLGGMNMPQMTELSGKYTNGPLVVAFTQLQTDSTNMTGSALSLTGGYGPAGVKNSLKTLAGAYDLGNGLRLGYLRQALLADGTSATKSDRATNQMSAIYTLGVNTFTVNYGQAKERNTTRAAAGSSAATGYVLGAADVVPSYAFGGKSSKFVGVAYKYSLSKMTSLEAKYERLDDAAGTLNGTPPSTLTLDGSGSRIRTRSTLGLNMFF